MTAPQPDIIAAYRSGFVQRYHANPDMARFGQTLAAHQWGVAMLIRLLHPNPSAKLISAALTHDVGEMVAGDLALPFKQPHPALAEMHAAIEKDARDAITGFELALGADDKLWLKMCDALEAFLFTSFHAPALIAQPDWQDMGWDIRYCSISIGGDVEKLIDELVPTTVDYHDDDDDADPILQPARVAP